MTVPFQGYQDWQPRVSPQSEDDLLFSLNPIPGVALAPFHVTLNAKYVGVTIVFESPGAQGVQVSVVNTGALSLSTQQFQFLGGAGAPGSYNFPLVNFIGDVLNISIVGSFTFHNGAVYVFGSRALTGIQTRPDGRPYPQNSQVAFYNVIATAPIVAAPASPSRFLIGLISIMGSNAATNAFLSISQNGAVVIVGQVQGVQNLPLPFVAGLLCDPGTAITANFVAAQPASFNVSYDLVV